MDSPTTALSLLNALEIVLSFVKKPLAEIGEMTTRQAVTTEIITIFIYSYSSLSSSVSRYSWFVVGSCGNGMDYNFKFILLDTDYTDFTDKFNIL